MEIVVQGCVEIVVQRCVEIVVQSCVEIDRKFTFPSRLVLFCEEVGLQTGSFLVQVELF